MKDLRSKLFDSARNLPSYLVHLPEITESLKSETAIGLIYIDGHGLSLIEERYGHATFDDIMLNLSRQIEALKGSVIRKNDLITVSEVQGYSFIIFLAGTRKEKLDSFLSKDAVQSAADRVQARLYSKLLFELYPYVKGIPQIDVGFSFGVYNPMVAPHRALYKLLDESREMAVLEHTQRDLRNRGRLQRIILEEHIHTVYQPIVNLNTREVMGYESLTRGPKYSEIEAPVILFALAEASGLVFELDRLCRKRAVVNAQGKPAGRKLFINTMPNLVFDPDLESKKLLQFLDNYGIPITDIVFEITERDAIENYASFRQAISYYTDAGVTLAIDDVGAGYSSLEAIMELKPSYVKIDSSITRGCAGNQGKLDMLKALQGLAKSISAMVIAEGVETKDDCDVMQELGIEYAQGYYFARPGAPFPEVSAQALNPS